MKMQAKANTKNSAKSISSVNINNQRVRFRKWKGKDKKKFLSILSNAQTETLTLKDTVDVLIRSQLESHKDQTFTQEEIRYLLSRIRAQSLGNVLSVKLHCQACQQPFTHEYKITSIIKAKHSTLDVYDDGEVSIKFGKIRNQDLYFEKIQEDEALEIFFNIEEFNFQKHYSIPELIDAFDELDLDTLDNILNYYNENRFFVNDLHEIKCPHCNEIGVYEFDELPGFFPESWFNEAFVNTIKEKQLQEKVAETFENLEENYDDSDDSEDFDS